MKILFLHPYPTEGASNRLRVEQYLPYLTEEKIKYLIRPFYSKKFYSILYSKGNYIKKVFFLFISALMRTIDVFTGLRFDIIFIHREAFPIGPPWIESIFAIFKKPVIFDFDDSIFLHSSSEHNRFIERFKWPDKTISILKLSKYIIVGNSFLRDFAQTYNENVCIIPTSIDDITYKPFPKSFENKNGLITIGWIGSNTTVNFLNDISEELQIIHKKYNNIKFFVIGGKIKIKYLKRLFCKNWALEEELNDLKQFDIGLMPMQENEWTKGKCGFKAILYMSMGIPAIVSDVGANREIIVDGQNGFLARNRNDWVKKLSLLIEMPELRKKIGEAGRKTVEEKYSLKKNAPIFIETIKKVYRDNYKKCVE